MKFKLIRLHMFLPKRRILKSILSCVFHIAVISFLFILISYPILSCPIQSYPILLFLLLHLLALPSLLRPSSTILNDLYFRYDHLNPLYFPTSLLHLLHISYFFTPYFCCVTIHVQSLYFPFLPLLSSSTSLNHPYFLYLPLLSLFHHEFPLPSHPLLTLDPQLALRSLPRFSSTKLNVPYFLYHHINTLHFPTFLSLLLPCNYFFAPTFSSLLPPTTLTSSTFHSHHLSTAIFTPFTFPPETTSPTSPRITSPPLLYFS